MISQLMTTFLRFHTLTKLTKLQMFLGIGEASGHAKKLHFSLSLSQILCGQICLHNAKERIALMTSYMRMWGCNLLHKKRLNKICASLDVQFRWFHQHQSQLTSLQFLFLFTDKNKTY